MKWHPVVLFSTAQFTSLKGDHWCSITPSFTLDAFMTNPESFKNTPKPRRRRRKILELRVNGERAVRQKA
jgi:hypothetical protein